MHIPAAQNLSKIYPRPAGLRDVFSLGTNEEMSAKIQWDGFSHLDEVFIFVILPMFN